ncbi:LYR motif-containing protein [Vibrio vulnificus]|uniref:hypothetical protein n=1 Tax=Vibrio vulnificus TaxID=672 RepID=UPI001CDD4B5E|nr:hypothetical protein [Vibrio vulnificus]MCA3928879.1 hypothetical protein [Vibrio vulnificus]
MFEDIKVKSISDWYPVLNWSKLPNFGSCHTKQCVTEFTNSYYRDEKIVTLYQNICQTLSADYASANVRISGDPGAGKTSFLYAIKKYSDNPEAVSVLSNFYFYILHINKVDDIGTESKYKDEIIYHVKRAWKEFYISCGQKDNYSRFKHQDLDDKALVNKLSDYYKNHKADFSKILVFVVDDVDLLPGEHVGTIVDLVLKNIEIGSVKKWLVIRKTTFDNYSAATKKKIEQFFPDPYQYPSISLYDIANYRVRNTSNSDDPKMPFSKEMCDQIVMLICEGNIREGLSLLKSVLEENFPGNMPSSSGEEFIQNYLDKCVVRTLSSSQKLIDLHAKLFRVSHFPIAIDILSCAIHHTSIDLVFGGVNDCLLKRNINSGYLVGKKDKTFKLKPSDFDFVLNRLVEHGLIEKIQKDRIRITEKGLITAHFCNGEYYYDYCYSKNNLHFEGDTYWQLAKRTLNHKEIMDTYQVWSNQRQ